MGHTTIRNYWSVAMKAQVKLPLNLLLWDFLKSWEKNGTEKILYAIFVAHLIIPRCIFNVLINYHSKTFLTMANEGYRFVF